MLIDSATTVNARGDTAAVIADTTGYSGQVRVRFVGSGGARLLYSAPGFAPDSTQLVTVTGPTLHLTTGNQTLGVGQLLTGQYVYVDNAVTTPLVVQLLKSDTLTPQAGQAFTLSATSVTIPVGGANSDPFEIQGNASGSAVLTARAPAYSQSTATVSVVQPRLAVSPKTVLLAIGQQAYSVGVTTRDQSGTSHVVAAALTIGDTSANAAVAQGDSLILQVPARQASTSVGVRGFVKGATQIVFSAQGYQPDTLVVSVDTGQLTLLNPPRALGPGQLSTNQMYVQLSYYTATDLVVNLASDNALVLTVPNTVTIPANSNYTYFTVTGRGIGTANVTATAAGVKPAPQVPVRISPPKLQLFFTTSTLVGQKNTLTVYAEDSAGAARDLNSPLTVTLTSSDPTHTTYDSSTITILPNSYYASTGITFTQAGGYTITGAAPGYVGANTTSNAAGALVLMQPGNAFSPLSVTISAGQTVMWENVSTVQHTTTSDTGLWDVPLNPTVTYIRTFSTPGTFTYHCNIHPAMTGTVIVQ